MKRKRLGNTDMEITPVGFGSWAIGGGNWEFGWGPQDDNKAIAAIQHEIELGVNWIDTAAVYGLGHSEELVAEAVKNMDPKPYIFTKCTLAWDENRVVHSNHTRASIFRECEASLRRLRTDVIDLYQVHWPTDTEDGNDEAWQAMSDLKKEGKVRYIGVSNFNVSQMKRAMRIAPISSLQPPYSLINRAIEDDILPFCEKNNIGVIVYSPMGAGMLTGAMTRERIANFPSDDWRRKNKNFLAPRLDHNLEIADKLKEVGKRHGRSAGEVAIAWTLRHTAVTAAIVGGRSPEQVDGIIGAMEFRLDKKEIREIEDFV